MEGKAPIPPTATCWAGGGSLPGARGRSPEVARSLLEGKEPELLPGEGPYPSPPPSKADRARLQAEAQRTEMWKQLWMRNVVQNTQTAGKHTSTFMSNTVTFVRTKGAGLFSKISAPFPSFFGPNADSYEEVLIDHIAYDTDGQGQIVEYDPAFLSRVGWATNLQGTVFSIRSIWWQFTWLMAIAVVYALLSGPSALVLDTMGSSVSPKGLAKLSFRLPSLKAQTFAVSLVGGLLSFLLSLFNSNGLDRWWKTRDCLGTVIGRSIDLSMQVSMYIRGYDRESDEIAYRYKREIIRYLNLAHMLVYRQANSIDELNDLVMDHSCNPPRQWITQEEMLLFQPEKQPKPGQLGEAVRRRKFFAQQLQARPRVTPKKDPPPQ